MRCLATFNYFGLPYTDSTEAEDALITVSEVFDPLYRVENFWNLVVNQKDFALILVLPEDPRAPENYQ